MEHSVWVLYIIPHATNGNRARSPKQNACNITVFGPRLYNSLPIYLRDIESVKTEKFIIKLDKFLDLIPDEPKMPNSVSAPRSYSIQDLLGLKEFITACEFQIRPRSSLSCFETTPSIPSMQVASVNSFLSKYVHKLFEIGMKC